MSETTPAEKTPKPSHKHLWGKLGAGALLLIVLSLLFIPYGIKWGIENYFVKNGAQNATVENVDFNPFTGELVLESVNASAGASRELNFARAAVRLDWWPLWKKRVHIQNVELKSAVIDVRQTPEGIWTVGSMTFGGERPEPQATQTDEIKDAKPWGFGIEKIALDDVSIRYADPKVSNNFRFEQLHGGNIFSWTPQQGSSFDILLHLTEGTIALKGSTHPFAQEKDVSADLNIDSLNLNWIAPLLAAQGIENFTGTLEAQTKLKLVVRPSEVSLESMGEMVLKKLQAKQAAAQIDQASINWNGETLFTMGAQGQKPALKLRGVLTAGHLDVTLLSPSLQVRQDELQWKGIAEYASEAESEAPSIRVESDTALSNLKIDDLEKKKNALTLGQLDLKALRVSGIDQITVEQVVLGNAQLLERPAETAGSEGASGHTVSFNALAIGDTRFGGNTLEINQIDLKGADIQIVRNAKGDLDLSGWIPKNEKKEESQTAKNQTEPSEFTIRIAQVNVSEDSGLTFRDNSVSPAFSQVLKPIEINVKNLNSSKADNPSPVGLKVGIGRYGELDIKGDVQAFAQRPTLNLQGKLDGLDLPPLTSYTAESTGYAFKQGHLGVDLQCQIDKGNLNSEVVLQIDKLELAAAGENGNGILGKMLGMPVGTALSLLRDSDDNIKLKIPIEGDLENPQFSFNDVLLKATSKAVQKATISHFAPLGVTLLTGVVLPPGSLFVAGKVVDWALTMRFEPIVFVPMQQGLSSEAQAYLDQMATLLLDKPKAKVIICGKATQPDVAALRTPAAPAQPKQGTEPVQPEAQTATEPAPPLSTEESKTLLTLAESRALKVKDHLVSKGVEASRLLICAPVLVADDDDPPLVEVSM